MFFILLAVFSAASTALSTKECEPPKYLCSTRCPPFPAGLQLRSETVCLRDTESSACVCWLQNPSSQLQTLFRCESETSGNVSQIMCNPHKDCFAPDPNGPVCMIILQCNCRYLGTFHEVFDHWRQVKATVHTKVLSSTQNTNGNLVDKVQEEVRDFKLKHLLFLLGFVIAPLLCWCLLNFFHEGKCRKKTPEPLEAQPIPTSRCTTVDNMNNNDDSCGERGCEDVIVISSLPRSRTSSSRSQSVPILHPSAPDDPDTVESYDALQQTLTKCESPPPYSESMERSFNSDFGPPPAYEEAMRGTDINIQHLWQTVFILPPGARENS